MVKRHFNVARIQGLTSIISFNQIIKVAESSVNINCKITILSNKINALLIKKTCLFSKYFTFSASQARKMCDSFRDSSPIKRSVKKRVL